MELNTHVSEESQADVDEQVSTTSRNHKDANWWDYEVVSKSSFCRVPKQASSFLRTEDCYEDYKEGWDRFRHGGSNGIDKRSISNSGSTCSHLLFVFRKMRR